MVVYAVNKSSSSDIYNHLINVDNSFTEPLSRRLNIGKYADKLYIHAQRVEAWCEGEMVGLVAYYRNDAEHFYHVSNVSIEAKFQHKGIAHKLLSQVFDSAKSRDVKKINLVAHKLIIPFYEKLGFTLGKQIDSEHNEMEKYFEDGNVLVSVCCLTYNHEKYLRDCLNGIVSQETNFKYEILIHDDASTDKTAEIIKEYEIKYPAVKPIYQTINQFSQGVQISEKYQFPRAKGKYIAFCEGDDYWTDPLKLQKQVDFLEAHPDFVACGTRYRYYYSNTKKFAVDHFEGLFNQGEKGIEYNHDNYFEIGRLPQVLTMMYRADTFPPEAYYHKLKNNQDDAMYYCMTLYGKIWLMNEVTGVYRKHDYSLTWHVSQVVAIGQAKMLHDIWLDCWQYDKSPQLRGTVLWSIQQLVSSTIRYSEKWNMDILKQCINEYNEIATFKERCYFYKRMLKALIVRIIKQPYKKKYEPRTTIINSNLMHPQLRVGDACLS